MPGTSEKQRKIESDKHLEKLDSVKKFVNDQLQRRGQVSNNRNFGITKTKLLDMLEEGIKGDKLIKFLFPKDVDRKMLIDTMDIYDTI